MEKTLTIIMPAYNEKNTVLQAIEQAKNADIGSYKKEIIVVDDGSTDGTRELISKAEGVRKALMPKNRGKGAALKEGIKQGTRCTDGHWVTIDDHHIFICDQKKKQ